MVGLFLLFLKNGRTAEYFNSPIFKVCRHKNLFLSNPDLKSDFFVSFINFMQLQLNNLGMSCVTSSYEQNSDY